MKKIILIGLVGLSPLMAFMDGAKIKITDSMEGKISVLGNRALKSTMSNNVEGTIEEYYCEDGSEGFSTTTRSTTTNQMVIYDSCTNKETVSVYIPRPENPYEMAQSFKSTLLAVQSNNSDLFRHLKTTNGYANYKSDQDSMSDANMRYYLASSRGSGGSYANVRTYDSEGNRIGNGFIIRDDDGDGKNDCTYGAWTAEDSKYHDLGDMNGLFDDYGIAEGQTGLISFGTGSRDNADHGSYTATLEIRSDEHKNGNTDTRDLWRNYDNTYTEYYDMNDDTNTEGDTLEKR